MKLAALKKLEPDQGNLALAQSGDHAAFGRIVTEQQRMVFSIALRAMRNRTVAEDLAQEVFLSLYRSLPKIASEAHLVQWLRRATVNRCIDEMRRMREVPLMEELEIVAQEAGADFLLHKRLRTLVDALPSQQKLALILRYQQDLEPQEISDALELPLNTVKSQLQRALAAIRCSLGADSTPRMVQPETRS